MKGLTTAKRVLEQEMLLKRIGNIFVEIQIRINKIGKKPFNHNQNRRFFGTHFSKQTAQCS
jgi:hypothetical protein